MSDAEEATQGEEKKKAKKMSSKAHSNAEFAWLAGCLYMHLGRMPNVNELLGCVRRGDKTCRFDGMLPRSVLDYDEAYFHDSESGFDRDMRKVDRGDAQDGVECIIKLRRGVEPLDHASSKLVQPVCESKNLFLQLQATFSATRDTVAASIFTHPPTKPSSAACKKVALAAWAEIDKLCADNRGNLQRAWW